MLRVLLLGSLSLLLAGYREALPGYIYEFPRDHFNHENFRTEWWYYTGNLAGENGKRFGFELVFFRHGDKERSVSNPSNWRMDDIYLAHAAFTDIDGRRFNFDERLNRSGPGIAGISFEKQRVWNGNWSAQWNAAGQTLTAISDEFRFTLDLRAVKPFVIHGLNGVSQKGDAPGEASYYVSFPRLAVKGNVQMTGQSETAVTGLAWMDHEWFTNQLNDAETGWDWFSAQFSDNTEIMLYDFRKKNGSIDSHSSGTYIDEKGIPRHLTSADFTLRPIEYWKKYPIKWRIEIPSLYISVDCAADLVNQELSAKTGINTYWEGAVTYSGSRQGVGYLEMTGYEKPVTLQ